MNTKTTPTQTWKASGSYFEACNCEVGCPCVFLSAPTTGDCRVLIGWHVERGGFGEVKLDDLNVAMAAHAPGPMLQVKWRVALYLDERATPEQADALGKIFSGQAGGHLAVVVPLIGEVLGVRRTPIEFRAEGKRRSLRIPKIAEMEIEAIDGQGGAEVTVQNPPMCVAPGHASGVAKSKRVSYQDHNLQWEVSGKNGFYSPFNYQSA
jgi:hypothetical protein